MREMKNKNSLRNYFGQEGDNVTLLSTTCDQCGRKGIPVRRLNVYSDFFVCEKCREYDS